MTAEATHRARLRWRCRRGMRELDVLLQRWLDTRWPDASDADRAGFERLLDCEDDALWAWCTGKSEPRDRALRRILRQIVTHSPRAPGG